MTLIEEFATKWRFKVSIDADDGTQVIRGKLGKSHVYEYSDRELGVMVMPYPKPPWGKSRAWARLVEGLEEAGSKYRITQSGEGEGCLVFDHGDVGAVRLIMRLCRIHGKRRVSAAQVDRLRAMAAVQKAARIGKKVP